MTAIILVWNPDEWNDWTYPAVLGEVAETGRFLIDWEVGGGADFAASGTEVWLVLQGRHGRGLIGHGVIVSERPAPRLQPPETASAAPAGSPLYVRVAFDALLPAGDQIQPGILEESVPGPDWEALPGPALAVDPSAESLLRALWSEFGPPPGAEPTQPVPGTVPAAAVSRVEVNRYEHSPDAHRACIAHHGTSCAACGFSFEIAYGDIGKDFIPVHHLVPVSQLGGTYELDPVTDLVPLCANCHAMAHLGVTTPRTVAELRRAMAAAGYLTGQTLTSNELQAQRDARRILNQH
ncbi:HNH endonuclease [Arthrobacter sp. NPDC058130]|uniref:HNH endonuclease n=1 Tax=Arthrobacter sp. NPDC058130 TaxID=3346353 RepID=UPI0036E3DEA8